jgi:hypothetical protein
VLHICLLVFAMFLFYIGAGCRRLRALVLA